MTLRRQVRPARLSDMPIVAVTWTLLAAIAAVLLWAGS